VKKELFWIGIILWWVVLFGFVGPFLISAESTIAVLLGFALIGVSAYTTYRLIRRNFTKRTDNAQDSTDGGTSASGDAGSVHEGSGR